VVLDKEVNQVNHKKAQAALEFLTTYAWAFLILSVTIGALYYFGIFDFSKYLPQECTFTSQFPCIDFTLRETDSIIGFRLLNNVGENIKVESLTVTNDAADPLSCTLDTPLPLDWDDSEEEDFKFTGCTGGVFMGGERIEAKITLTYYSPLTNPGDEPRHNLKGKIIGLVG